MINAISAADIAFIMSSSQVCELIECSRPIRFFIVSVMYNYNNIYHDAAAADIDADDDSDADDET